MAKPEDLDFLAPWERIPDGPEGRKRGEQILCELKREIPSNHLLSWLTLKAIATRRNQDDVLFEIFGRDEKLAVVHLTGRKETDPRWPRTRFFTSWKHWVNAGMIPDHEDFTCDDTQW